MFEIAEVFNKNLKGNQAYNPLPVLEMFAENKSAISFLDSLLFTCTEVNKPNTDKKCIEECVKETH